MDGQSWSLLPNVTAYIENVSGKSNSIHCAECADTWANIACQCEPVNAVKPIIGNCQEISQMVFVAAVITSSP